MYGRNRTSHSIGSFGFGGVGPDYDMNIVGSSVIELRSGSLFTEHLIDEIYAYLREQSSEIHFTIGFISVLFDLEILSGHFYLPHLTNTGRIVGLALLFNRAGLNTIRIDSFSLEQATSGQFYLELDSERHIEGQFSFQVDGVFTKTFLSQE